MSDTLSNILGWLTGPSSSQQALMAGNYTDPSLMTTDRSQALGQAAMLISQLGQRGAGPGALMGALGSSLAGAGQQGTQFRQGLQMQQAQIAEEQAKTGLISTQADAARWSLSRQRAMMRMLGFDPDTMTMLPDTGDQNTAAGTTGQLTGPYRTALLGSESSGKWDSQNAQGYVGGFQFGAPRLADLGLYTPGPKEQWAGGGSPRERSTDQWSGTFNIPGMPQIKTLADFKASPQAQLAAQDANEQNTKEFIQNNGLMSYVGKTIDGVPVTLNGMLAAAHLGGNGGLVNYLRSNGQINPSDGQTRISDYMRRFASTDINLGPQPDLNPAQSTIMATSGAGPAPDASAPAGGPIAPMPAPPPPAPPGPPSPPPPGGGMPGAPPPGGGMPGGMPGAMPGGMPGGMSGGMPGGVGGGPPGMPGTMGLNPAQAALARPLTSPAPGVPPGIAPAGAMRVGGSAFGISPGATPAQAIRQLPPTARAALALSNDPFTGIMRYQFPQQTYVYHSDGTDGFTAGSVIQAQFDPQTGKTDLKQLQAGVTPEYSVQQTNALRKELNDVTDRKSFNTLQVQAKSGFDAYDHLLSNPQDAAADYNLVHAFAKALDPGAIVREGSYKVATQNPILEDQLNRIIGTFTGDTARLTATQRQQIVGQLSSLYTQKAQEINSSIGYYRDLATQQGVNPNHVGLPFSEPTDITSWIAAKRGARAPAAQAPGLPAPAMVAGPGVPPGPAGMAAPAPAPAPAAIAPGLAAIAPGMAPRAPAVPPAPPTQAQAQAPPATSDWFANFRTPVEARTAVRMLPTEQLTGMSQSEFAKLSIPQKQMLLDELKRRNYGR